MNFVRWISKWNGFWWPFSLSLCRFLRFSYLAVVVSTAPVHIVVAWVVWRIHECDVWHKWLRLDFSIQGMRGDLFSNWVCSFLGCSVRTPSPALFRLHLNRLSSYGLFLEYFSMKWTLGVFSILWLPFLQKLSISTLLTLNKFANNQINDL